jgi:hypothetical protein
MNSTRVKAYTEWPGDSCVEEHLRSFSPFVVKAAVKENILNFEELRKSDELVEVSVRDRGEDFPGDPSQDKCVRISLSSLCEDFVNRKCQRSNKVTYLSQFPLFGPAFAFNRFSTQTPGCMENIVRGRSCRANLWLNVDRVSTRLHYDASHNFLAVVSGEKKLLLVHPKYTPLVEAYDVSCTNPQHSFMRSSELKKKISPVNRHLSQSLNEDIIPGYEVNLRRGDCIFIPEGFWHQVRSSECTMAINYWFDSGLSNLVTGGYCNYLLRLSINKLLSDRSSQLRGLKSRKRRSSRQVWSTEMVHNELVTLRSNLESSNQGEDSTRKSISLVEEQLLFFLKDCPTGMLGKVLSEQPAVWTKILMAISNEAAAIFLDWLDHLDDEENESHVENVLFFEAIFNSLGEKCGIVKTELIRKRDSHRHRILHSLL